MKEYYICIILILYITVYYCCLMPVHRSLDVLIPMISLNSSDIFLHVQSVMVKKKKAFILSKDR